MNFIQQQKQIRSIDRQVRVSIQEADGGMYNIYFYNRYGLLSGCLITYSEAKEISDQLFIQIQKKEPSN